MSNPGETGEDDAPITTSKTAHPARELIGRSVTINKPVGEVYAFYRDLSNAPRYMDDVKRVDLLGDGRTHWVATGPTGGAMEWDSVITEDVPDQSITWKSVGDDQPQMAGRATFQGVEGRGTVVTLTLSYDQPGGFFGKLLGKATQHDPAIQARRNLRRMKQLLETGEIATGARNVALDEQGKTH